MTRSFSLSIILFISILLAVSVSLAAQEFQEVRKLLASDAAANDELGNATSIDDDTIIVAARFDDDDAGSAYVFERNQGGVNNWGQVTKLVASDAAAGDELGFSVSFSNDTVVVGARRDDDAGTDSGSAYIFERNQGGADHWGQVTKLTAPDAAAGDSFGQAVSTIGDTVVIGARFDDDACLGDPNCDSGSAYIFERHWGQATKLTASDAAAGDRFGQAVSISSDTVVIGAFLDDEAVTDSGSAYIFERDQGGADHWGQVTQITASDPATGDNFGNAVAISGDTIVAGARRDDDVCPEDPQCNSGSAYVFERNQGGTNRWGEVTKLTASDAAAGAEFGQTVAIDDDTIVIGAHFDEDVGAAYVFKRNQGGANNWGQADKLTASDAAAGDEFGIFVPISGSTIVVGALYDDDACPGDPDCNSGSAYIFSAASLFADGFESGNTSAWPTAP